MISGLRRIRKISHQRGEPEYSSPGFTSRVLSSINNDFQLLQLEECHYSGMLRDAQAKQIPFHRRQGEISVIYLLCGSLKYLTSAGVPGTMNPGSCLWISSADGEDVEFESTTPIMREFWSVNIRASAPPGSERIPPLSCQIPTEVIPVHRGEDGIIVRVIAGEYEGLRGPLYAQSGTVLFLDVSIPPLTPLTVTIPDEYTVLLYCLEGRGLRDSSSGSIIQSSELIRYGQGEEISLSTETEEVRLLLIGGTSAALTEL